MKVWYGASLLFKGIQSAPGSAAPLWEESIRIFEAETESEAAQLARAAGLASEHEYETDFGIVRWTFQDVECVFEIGDATPTTGTEVFSRFLRESEVESLRTPFDD